MNLKAHKKQAWLDASSRDDKQRVEASSSIKITYDCDRFFITDLEKYGSLSAQVRLEPNGEVFLAATVGQTSLVLDGVSFEQFSVELLALIKKLKGR